MNSRQIPSETHPRRGLARYEAIPKQKTFRHASDEFLTEMSSRQIPSEIHLRRDRARHEAIAKQKPSEAPHMNF